MKAHRVLLVLLLASCTLEASQASVPGPAATPSSIEGTVVNAAGGAALKGATVQLVPSSGRGATLKTETDEKGSFLFKEVAAGRYQLTADRTGFMRQAYGARGSSSSGTILTVAADQVIKDVVFKLKPTAVISGRVINEEGEPMPNVAVSALRTVYRAGKREMQTARGAASNDLGEFRIANLAPEGCYFVIATPVLSASALGEKPPENAPEFAYVAAYFPGSPDATGASCIEVGMGVETRGTDIRLMKTKTVRLKGRIAGTPQDFEITPELGGAVLLTRKGHDLLVGGGGIAAANPPEWTFEFKGLRAGSYLMIGTVMSKAGMLTASSSLEIGEEHLDNITIRVEPHDKLPGNVLAEGTEPSKLELKGAQVALEPLETANRFRASAPVGSDGQFALGDVARERYRVRLTGGPETAYVKTVRLGDQDAPEAEIDLRGGVSGRSLQILLSMEGAQVDGVVSSHDGKPMAGATVALVPDSRRSELYKSVTTDQNGAFSIKGITPGDYKLLAWEEVEPGAFGDPEFLKPFESKAETVSLKEKDRKSYSLKVIPAEAK